MNRPKIFPESYSPNFWDILKREKESAMTSFIGGHNRQILSVEDHTSLLYPVFRMSHKSEGKRGFPAPVLPENIIGFPCLERDIDVSENLFSFHRNSEVLYLYHCKKMNGD